MATIRKIVSLNDPKYFCNRSWTLSYSFITNSWISFHSYLPNFYVGENNFFYSGIKSCCDPDIEFAFFAGELVPNPSTTTTTSSLRPLTTTSTTTAIPLDCVLTGVVNVTTCDLAGTGVITVPPVPPPCLRPLRMTSDNFVRGYVIVGPINTYISSTASKTAACNAITYINNNSDWAVETVGVELVSIQKGAKVYVGIGNTDCTVLADGWYFTEFSFYSGDVFQITNGVIVSIENCNPTTTTSTTTIAPAVQTFKIRVTGTPDMKITSVIPNFYTMNPGNTFPILAGEQKTGIVNSGGVTVTIGYDCLSKIPQIMFIRNNIVVGNAGGIPIGTGQFFAYNISWTAGDIIEIRLL